MSARDDEHGRGQRDRAVLQEDRLDVPGQVMDGDDRLAESRRPRPWQTRRRRAASRRGPGPESPRSRRRPARSSCASAERALDDAADVTHVLARGDLRHHAAPLAVDFDLRRDDVRIDPPGLRRIARSSRPRPPRSRRTRSRCRGRSSIGEAHAPAQLVRHTSTLAPAFVRDSRRTARAMPFSVMMPEIRRAGVTSNAGFQTLAPSGASARRAEVRHLAGVALLDRNRRAVGGRPDRSSRAARRRRTARCARAAIIATV